MNVQFIFMNGKFRGNLSVENSICFFKVEFSTKHRVEGGKKRVDEAVLYESPTSDTLTTPFIKRKINNKRMCTMKLENIKQTKTEMTNYATRRACKMNLFI
jgi:hypothetical protein